MWKKSLKIFLFLKKVFLQHGKQNVSTGENIFLFKDLLRIVIYLFVPKCSLQHGKQNVTTGENNFLRIITLFKAKCNQCGRKLTKIIKKTRISPAWQTKCDHWENIFF